jgi:hypothetical protein
MFAAAGWVWPGGATPPTRRSGAAWPAPLVVEEPRLLQSQLCLQAHPMCSRNTDAYPDTQTGVGVAIHTGFPGSTAKVAWATRGRGLGSPPQVTFFPSRPTARPAQHRPAVQPEVREFSCASEGRTRQQALRAWSGNFRCAAWSSPWSSPAGTGARQSRELRHHFARAETLGSPRGGDSSPRAFAIPHASRRTQWTPPTSIIVTCCVQGPQRQLLVPA